MYDSPRRRSGFKRVAGDHARQKPVEAHEGSYRDFLRCHASEASAVARGTADERRAFAAKLPARAADNRNIKCAIDYLIRDGEKAPGPNGIRLEQLTEHEQWDLARTLGRMMRSGWKPRNRNRRVYIPKASGTGTRPLDISDAEIKVAQRAIAQMVQPLLDQNFDERSFGFRPHRGRNDALATAELIMTGSNNHVVITADVANAFTQVPRSRLTDVMRHQGLPEDLIRLINGLLGPQRRGLPQGGPLSPLLLNLYLDNVLDRVWRQRHPETPLIRVADDLLVICSNYREARAVYADLQRLVVSAGMPLKGDPDTDIRQLNRGQEAQWLGYRLTLGPQGLEVGIGDQGWSRLSARLSECHLKPDAPLRAVQTVLGWADQLGPCFRHEDAQDVYDRVVERAREQAFEELPEYPEFRQAWERGYLRYRCLRRCIFLTRFLDGADGSADQHQNPAVLGCGSGAPIGGVPLPSFSARARLPEAVLATDGACLNGSRGIGGWGFVLVLHSPYGRLRERVTGADSHPRATNNRMELTAVVKGFEALSRPTWVHVVTDSQYVYQGLTEGLARWASTDWRRARGGRLKNGPLWRRLSELIKSHRVDCEWVRGHSGHPLNEECDRMAQMAIGNSQEIRIAGADLIR